MNYTYIITLVIAKKQYCVNCISVITRILGLCKLCQNMACFFFKWKVTSHFKMISQIILDVFALWKAKSICFNLLVNTNETVMYLQIARNHPLSVKWSVFTGSNSNLSSIFVKKMYLIVFNAKAKVTSEPMYNIILPNALATGVNRYNID